MTNTVRRGLRRLLSTLDPEAIAPLQSVFYACFVAAGAYMLALAAEPVSQVDQTLGSFAEHVWAAMLIFGPLTWFTGRRMRRCVAYWAMWLQLWGDLLTGTATAIYAYSVAAATPWGTGTFAPFLGAATALCIALITVCDGWRIAQVEREVRSGG